MLLLPADMLGEIVTKGKLEPSVNHCYLCWFVRMDMMDLPPRRELASATCIYATLGYEPPGSRRGDGGELQQVLALYLARTITRRSHLNLNARCPTHTKNCYLLNAGAYNSQILCSLFRHTRGVRSKSSRALRLKLQHSYFLVARCYNFSLARSVLTHFNRSRSVTVLHSLDSRVRALKFHSGP